MKWLKGRKTYIVSILLGIVALLDVITGEMSISQFLTSPQLNQLLAAFGLASLRNGIG